MVINFLNLKPLLKSLEINQWNNDVGIVQVYLYQEMITRVKSKTEGEKDGYFKKKPKSKGPNSLIPLFPKFLENVLVRIVWMISMLQVLT